MTRRPRGRPGGGPGAPAGTGARLAARLAAGLAAGLAGAEAHARRHRANSPPAHAPHDALLGEHLESLDDLLQDLIEAVYALDLGRTEQARNALTAAIERVRGSTDPSLLADGGHSGLARRRRHRSRVPRPAG